MQGFETIAGSILTLGIAMLVGFVCVKTGYISEEDKRGLSRVIVRVTLPVLVITSLTNLEFNHEKLINSIQVLLLSLTVILILYALGRLMSSFGRMEKSRRAMHCCMTCFGNVVFMAFPLIRALYGDEGLLYAAVFQLANDTILWTLGVYSMNASKKQRHSLKESVRNMLNPGTIAFLLAFILMASGVRFTGIIGEVMNGIGGATTYMSMLFIGGTLASVNFKHIYKRAGLFVLTAVKMLALPILLALILKFVNIDTTAAAVIVLQAAMPTSTVLVVLGEEYGGDVLYCAEGVFVTHLLGLVTLPAVYYLMNLI